MRQGASTPFLGTCSFSFRPAPVGVHPRLGRKTVTVPRPNRLSTNRPAHGFSCQPARWFGGWRSGNYCKNYGDRAQAAFLLGPVKVGFDRCPDATGLADYRDTARGA